LENNLGIVSAGRKGGFLVALPRITHQAATGGGMMASASAVRGVRYNTEHFAAIERSLGNKYRLTDEQKAQITWAAQDLNVDEKIFKPIPGASAELRRLQALSERLNSRIVNNDPGLLGYDLYEDALDVLSRIMIVQAPAKLVKGRIAEARRESYILKMAKIYKDITGRNAGAAATGNTGPFLRFLTACMAPLDRVMLHGLNRAVQNALPKQNRKSRNSKQRVIFRH